MRKFGGDSKQKLINMNWNKILIALPIMGVILLTTGCKKEEGFGPLTDSKPNIPVTVSNVFDYRPSPTVKASKAENKILITLQIPSNSGRTIKEISKIATSTT